MTEELLREYAALRSHRLMLNPAQAWVFSNKVVEHWTAGAQAETSLKLAAEEINRA